MVAFVSSLLGEMNVPDAANLDKLFETILEELQEPYKDGGSLQDIKLVSKINSHAQLVCSSDMQTYETKISLAVQAVVLNVDTSLCASTYVCVLSGSRSCWRCLASIRFGLCYNTVMCV